MAYVTGGLHRGGTIRGHYRAWNKHGNNVRKSIPAEGIVDKIATKAEWEVRSFRRKYQRRNTGQRKHGG